MRWVYLLALILAALWSLIEVEMCGGQEITAASDLRVFQTAHYRVHTDLDEDLSYDLGHRLDVMYDEYSRRLSIFGDGDDSTPLEVYIVHSQKKYLHLVGLPMAGTGGAFSAQRHLLAAFLDGQGRDSLRRTLQHEAFHQFAARTIGANLPIWLNEGLAQVFEEAIWTGNGFILGQVPPRRVRQLRSDIQDGRLIDFNRILTETGPQWAANWHDRTACATQYNQAWAMTHFLIYCTDSDGKPKYRDRLIEMLKLLHDGEDSQEAFAQEFSSNIDGFRERFLEFADQLAPTTQATLIENQGVLADILLALNKRGQSFDSFDDFRAACIRQGWHVSYRLGRIEWESNKDPSVYFQDSTGRMLGDDEQFFELAGSRPLADMVCRYDGLPTLRTRFYDSAAGIEHETLVESSR